MKILTLKTTLFPGREVLQEALESLEGEHEITREDASTELTDHDWDRIIQAVAAADRVIVL